MTELNQRVALITGGAKGIGRAVALDLAAHGWAVAIGYRTSVAEATQVINAVRSNGGTGLAIQCDVSQVEAAEGRDGVEHQREPDEVQEGDQGA